MIPQNASEKWFALQVRTRWEESTVALLGGKGFETFLPNYRTNRRCRGRIKEVTAPLFPGYVFCQFDAQNRLPILVTPGVVGIVGSGRIPIPVDESEIEAIRSAICSGMHVEPWPYLEIGQTIRIEDPTWGGLEGILISFKGSQRIVVSVSLLRRSVALEIDRSVVRPVPAQRPATLDACGTPALLRRVVA
ncbi:MAG: transcription termination/antitermination protein NusG [Candidatus Acidiferrales bacterium]